MWGIGRFRQKEAPLDRCRRLVNGCQLHFCNDFPKLLLYQCGAEAHSIGASLSNVVSGYVVHAWGFNAGFLFLASVAALAFAIFGLMMPETKRLQPISAASLLEEATKNSS